MSDAFRHVESARTIVFGPGALADSADLIGVGYTLLSTPRAAASAPGVLERAATRRDPRDLSQQRAHTVTKPVMDLEMMTVENRRT
jgi:hypothetical protein